MGATFKSNSAGWAAMAVGEEMTGIVRAEAERAKAIAEGLSADFEKTGDYLSSFNVRTEIVALETRAGSHPVVAGILENVSDHAAAVEWGNAHDHTAHHVLSRTLDALHD